MTTKTEPKSSTMDELKEEYIYGTINEDGQIQFLSYNKLAEKHNVHVSAIKKAGTAGNWTSKRKDYRTKTELKVTEKKSEHAAATIVQSDDKFEETGELLRKRVWQQLEDDLDFRTSDLVNLSIALINSQKVVKTAQGEILDRVKIESSQDVKLNITDPDFMNEELEFAKKLIQDRRGGL